MSVLFECVAVGPVLVYLLWRGVHHHRHNNRDWYKIVGQLREGNSWRDQLHNSRLAIELIHYAGRHGDMDAAWLAELRLQAVETRLAVLGIRGPEAAR